MARDLFAEGVIKLPAAPVSSNGGDVGLLSNHRSVLPDFRYENDTQNATAQSAYKAAQDSPLASVIPDFPEKVVGLAMTESSLGMNLYSPTGPKGPFQFSEATAKDMGLDVVGQDERFDTQKSAQAAVKYLERLYNQFNNEQDMFTAYNAGPGRLNRVKQGLDVLNDEQQSYYNRIIQNMPQTGTKVAAGNTPTRDDILRQLMSMRDAREAAAATLPASTGPGQVQAEDHPVPDQTVQNPLLAGIEQFQQGLLLNFGDEAVAGIQAGLDYAHGLTTGQTFDIGDRYQHYLGQARSRLNQFSQNHPYVSTTAEAAGMAVPMFFTGGATTARGLANTATTAARGGFAHTAREGGKAAVSGAAAGGVAAAGEAQEDRMSAFNLGAGLGGAAGVGAAATLPVMGKLFRSGAEAFSALRNAKHRAESSITKAFGRDDISRIEARNLLDSLGDEAILADVGGENVMDLADSLSNLPGHAKQRINRFLDQRQAGRNQRVSQSIKDTLSGADFYNELEVFEKAMEVSAAPYYRYAESIDIPLSDTLHELLSRPSIKKGWKHAQNMAKESGEKIPDGFQFVDGGVVPDEAGIPSVKSWDWIKRGLDRVIEKETDKVTGKISSEGRFVIKTKKILTDEVDRLTDGAYALARGTYAGPAAARNAMNAGRKFLREDAEVIQRDFAKMTEFEKDAFRVGAARHLRDRILSSKDGASAYNRIFDNDLLKEKIRVIMPDNEAYERFENEMLQELLFSETRHAVKGNSATAKRLLAEADMELDLAPGGLKRAFVMTLIRKAWKHIKAPPEQVADQIAEMLLSPKLGLSDPTSVIKDLSNPGNPQMRRNIRSILSALTGATVGRETFSE